jgi:type IV secretion system protein VirB10
MVNATPAQKAAALSYSATGQAQPCIPGQPCNQTQPYGYAQQNGGGAGQVSPEQQEAQQLAAKERERAYESRFSSNLAYTRPEEAPQQQAQTTASAGGSYLPASMSSVQQGSSLVNPRAAGDAPATPASSASVGVSRKPEVNIDSAMGQPYVLYEGATIDTVLMNRLDGDAVGPVKVLVSNPVYSHDHQHVLIPDGTIVLGEAKKIGGTGFGQQRRMAVSFHRLIMPDGYSVDLDQFHGLDQIGEEGLKIR